jgi:hypothetical protein
VVEVFSLKMEVADKSDTTKLDVQGSETLLLSSMEGKTPK